MCRRGYPTRWSCWRYFLSCAAWNVLQLVYVRLSASYAYTSSLKELLPQTTTVGTCCQNDSFIRVSPVLHAVPHLLPSAQSAILGSCVEYR